MSAIQQSRSAHESTGERLHSLPLTVLFTTVSGTLSALRKAAQLASELEASIQILVPHVVPYPLPLDKPRVDPAFRLRHFHTVCERGPIETFLDIRLCRDANACILEALEPHSLLVMAGRQSWWRSSNERSLAKRLTRAGHQVVLVDERGAR